MSVVFKSAYPVQELNLSFEPYEWSIGTSGVTENSSDGTSWLAIACLIGTAIIAGGVWAYMGDHNQPEASETKPKNVLDYFSVENFSKNRVAKLDSKIQVVPVNHYATFTGCERTSRPQEALVITRTSFVVLNQAGTLKCTELLSEVETGVYASYLKEKGFKLYQPK